MTNEVSTRTLGEVSENISRRFDFTKVDEVVFINTGDVLNGKFLHCSLSPKIGLPGQAKKGIQKGDILFSEIRPANGRFALVDFDVDNYVVSTKFMVIKTKGNIDTEFLYIFLSQRQTLHEFQRIAETRSGTFPQITFDSIMHLQIPLLPLESQQKIVKFISQIDHKIENNRQMKETLEEIARAIFKSWFVDFDPVHAKAAGNAPAHMDAETAALFPSSFGDDGLPVGWKASKFENLIEFKNGYAFKSKEISKDFKTNFAIFKMGHIKVGGGFNDSCKTDYLISEASPKMEKYILETGDVLMSMTDMKDNVRLLGHTALFYEQNVNFLVNQRVGLIKAKKEITNYPYIYCLTNNKTFLNEIRKRANSGVQVNLSTDGIKTTPTIMPPLSLMAKFGSLSYPIFERIFSSSKENQTLAELRDTLLPKLMSGEIRVKDAEREVGAAV